MFTDFVGFTEISENMSPADLVEELSVCFKAFDEILEQYKIEKNKTIGDAYMAVGNIPAPIPDYALSAVYAGIAMQNFITGRKQSQTAIGKHAFEMRLGIHIGPLVAGLVGTKKFQYDIWGDTVNTASRLESNGEAGKVNISQSTYDLVKNQDDLQFGKRGKISVKGKGEIEMYFVSRSL
ncbi:MAG: adenylate cyclase [Bacteroidia bacterium]|jgi:adenylate cyclase